MHYQFIKAWQRAEGVDSHSVGLVMGSQVIFSQIPKSLLAIDFGDKSNIDRKDFCDTPKLMCSGSNEIGGLVRFKTCLFAAGVMKGTNLCFCVLELVDSGDLDDSCPYSSRRNDTGNLLRLGEAFRGRCLVSGVIVVML